MGLPIRSPLLLPDGYGVLDAVDGFAACSEGLVSMRSARGDADGHFAHRKIAHPMDGRNRRPGMLAGDPFQHAPHLLFSKALVRFVLEARHGLAVSVVPNDAVEDADAARTCMLDRNADTVERDLFVGHGADHDRCASGYGRQDVDSVSVPKCLVRFDEISVHRQPHALEELRERWKALSDGISQSRLWDARLIELERRAVAASQLLRGGVVVNANLHPPRTVAGLEKRAARGSVVESTVVTESGLKLISWVVGASFVGAMLAIPQPVDPWEMPSLVLEREATVDAIRFDEALATEALESREARTLQSLFLDHGRAEASPPYELREYNRRQADIHRATKALIDKHGPAAFEAMRAGAVEEFIDAFYRSRGVPRDDHEVAMLGGFPEIAVRYGLMKGDVVVAPELSIRALYKARWNAIHRQDFTAGFSKIELQAYWGWLALHGWGTPLDTRQAALVSFREAGGLGTEEAAALFDVLDGRFERAGLSLRDLYEQRGELRLRNLSLGALHAALLPQRTP